MFKNVFIFFVSLIIVPSVFSQLENTRNSSLVEKKTKTKRKKKYMNMLEFSRNGFDISNSSESYDVSSSFQNNEVEHTITSVRLNYARKMVQHFWIQGIFNYHYEEFDYADNSLFGVNDRENSSLAFQILGIFDFDKNPTSSFFIKGGLTVEITEENQRQITSTTTDMNVVGGVIAAGKRFSLKPLLGVSNISYSASVSYGFATGDYDLSTSFTDSDVDIAGFRINVLEIGVFF